MKQLLFAAFLLICLLAPARNDWHTSPMRVEPGLMAIDTVPRCYAADLHVRAAAGERGECSWSLLWHYADSANYAYASVTLPGAAADEVYGSHCQVETGVVADGMRRVITEAEPQWSGGEYSLKVVYDGYSARLYAGERMQELIAEVAYDGSRPSAVMLDAHNPLLVRRLTAEGRERPALELSCAASLAQLQQRLEQSADPAEGVWEYLDRDMRQDQATLGGRYRLATVSNGKGAYDVVYLSGAQENAEEWRPLMLKGRLTPTIFPGNYDLMWIEAGGERLEHELNAQLGADGSLLELRFPLQGSTLRFRRCAQLHLAPSAIE